MSPGARHSKASRHGRSIQSRYGQRKVDTRNVLPVKAILCDDSRTAPAYFNELKREVRQSVVLKIVPAKCTASAGEVIDRAIREQEELRDGQKKGETGDSVWALIDLEQEARTRSRAQDEERRAAQAGIHVALSDPCFEVWTLLHLEDTGEAFQSCNHVLRRLAAAWKSHFNQPFPRKAQADYSKIIPLRHDAVRRAKRHREAPDHSWTEVYALLEEIESPPQ